MIFVINIIIFCYPLVDCLVAPATCGAIADAFASFLPRRCLVVSRLAVALPSPRCHLAVTLPPLLPVIVIITSAVTAP